MCLREKKGQQHSSISPSAQDPPPEKNDRTQTVTGAEVEKFCWTGKEDLVFLEIKKKHKPSLKLNSDYLMAMEL